MRLKKLLLCLLLACLMAGCGGEKPDLSYEVESFAVDMSGYNGVKSVGHAFRGVSPAEVFRALEENGSAVFYLGYTGCHFCQKTVKVLNEAALELGVTVYYIDGYSTVYPLNDENHYDQKLIEALNDYLRTDENGEKALYTPHVFTIINGKIAESMISYDDTGNEEKDLENLGKTYRKMLEPFKS